MGALGPKLLNGADQGVGNDHAHEKHVAVAAGFQQQQGQNDVEQVEQGQYIAAQDLACAAFFAFGLPVAAPGFPERGGFLRSQPVNRCAFHGFLHPGNDASGPFNDVVGRKIAFGNFSKRNPNHAGREDFDQRAGDVFGIVVVPQRI